MRHPEDDAVRRAFGRRVYALRRERALSQERLAQLAGVHRTFISIIERGAQDPSLTVVVRIGRALGVVPDDLLRDAWEQARAGA